MVTCCRPHQGEIVARIVVRSTRDMEATVEESHIYLPSDCCHAYRWR